MHAYVAKVLSIKCILNIKYTTNKIILKSRLITKSRPPSRSQDLSSVSTTTLSVLYTRWSNLPYEDKRDYKVLRSQFKRNYVNIKNSLKSQPRRKVTHPAAFASSPEVIDLREKFRKQKQLLKSSTTVTSISKFAHNIKRTLQDSVVKTTPFKGLTKVLKNSIFESFIAHDEPFRPLKEAEMSKIPFKDHLLVSGLKGDLFISGIKAASDHSLLMRNQIKSVIAIGSCAQINHFTSITGGYLELPTVETETSILHFKENYPRAIKFLENKLIEGNVLICCFYGACRSCVLAVVFLMKKYKAHLDKALSVVKCGRRCCRLSAAATELLKEIEFNLFSLG